MGQTGPITRKREPTLLERIGGVGLGILAILLSPLAMNAAFNQHAAKDFAGAKEASVQDSSVGGYVWVRGAPVVNSTESAKCLAAGKCVYQEEQKQQMSTTSKRECGTIVQNESVRVLSANGQECDKDGNCESCYLVERDTWKTIETVTTAPEVQLGAWKAKAVEGGVFLDTRAQTVERGVNATGVKERSVYTIMDTPLQLLVVGQSNDGMIGDAGKKTNVFSAFDQGMTAQKLEARDKGNRLALFAGTFVLLFVGWVLVFGPLEWAGRLFMGIPVLGSLLSQGTRAVSVVAALILSIALWVLLFVVVGLLQVWWLALIVVLGLLGWLIARGKKKAA